MYSFLDNITENKTFTATFKPDFCIVKFVMPDGSLIHEAKIKKGASAESVAPQFPNVPGQTAVGWDKSLDNITEDVTVFAVYMQDNIKVTLSTARRQAIKNGELCRLYRNYAYRIAHCGPCRIPGLVYRRQI